MATLKNTTINDTGYLQLPSGTTAQRPVSPTTGMARWNTTLIQAEIYNGTSWVSVTNSAVPTVYQSASLYAQLNDNKVYSLGTLTADVVEIVAYGSYGTDEVNTSLTVLKMNGGAQTRIPQGDPGSTHTVSVWYRSNSVNDYGMLYSKYISPGTSSYGNDIWDGNGNNAIYLNAGDGYNNPYAGSTGLRFNNNSWYHYCFTFNGSTAYMYLNGSLLGAPATYRSFNGYTGPWSLGSWSGTSQFGNYALNNGRFYKYAVFPTALSSADVLALYNAGM
jgi:hypothetical protein